MEMIIIVIDVAIAFLAIWVLVKLQGYGGPIGQALNLVGYGTIIVGVSQFFETAGLYFLGSSDMNSIEFVHIIHHLILLIGMTLVFLGFKKLMDKN